MTTGIDYAYFIKPHASRRKAGLTREITKLEYESKTEIISFAEGLPNESVFPFQSIQVELKDGSIFELKRPEIDKALQYIPTQGYPPLVKFLQDFIQKIHQPPRWEERGLQITTGSQEGLSKTFDMILDEGDVVLSQNPLYLGIEIILRPFNPVILAVEQDEYGMRSDKLLKILKERKEKSDKEGCKMPKVLYINATGSNPTGTTIPEARRKEIYDICCKYNILIMEDDAYFFMNFAEDNPKSFLSMDTEGRVIRYDSFSKVLSSGIRLGWLTGPRELLRNIELHIQSSSLHSSSLSQVVIENLLRNWGMEKLQTHLGEVRQLYKTKCAMMMAAVERHLKDLCEWNVPAGGMFVWLRVLGISDVYDMVMVRAVKKGITFVPGHAFMADPKAPCNYVRASFSRASPEQMERGMKSLAELFREEKVLKGKSNHI